MSLKTDDPQSKAHFYELLQDFDNAMLVTVTANAMLRARPMRILLASEADGIWFVSYLDSPKNAEIVKEPKATITCQKNDRYMSVSGYAELSQDKTKINQLWNEGLKLWFPEGKDSGRICLIHFFPVEGEFWDYSRLTSKAHFVLEATKSWMFHTQIQEKNIGDNLKVQLRSTQQQVVPK